MSSSLSNPGPPAHTGELAESAVDRFLRYVQIDTQSDEDSQTYPSTRKQLDLLQLLVAECIALGLEDVHIDAYGYVTATIPATVDHEVPTIAFFAHVDTSPSVTGAGVSPRRVRYEGGVLPLGAPGQELDPDVSPELGRHAGHDLVTTDGTTLLGADDKAGVAEIMAAAAYLVENPGVPHGRIRLAFNPDEEIRRGVIHFPVESFGAFAAYTLDGGSAGLLEDETFSGAQVRLKIRGRAIHAGSAKGELVNAIKLAAAIVERLPKDRLSPETTEGREGFVHPAAIEGQASAIDLRINIRDFDDGRLDELVAYVLELAAGVEASEPRCSIAADTVIHFRNPRPALDRSPEIAGNLEEAMRRVGLEPRRTVIRGGTDGSLLTAMGLPTSNIFTGAQDVHSEREWICVEDMGLAAATIVELVQIWAAV
jgi:tripeptide aminopeptidase